MVANVLSFRAGIPITADGQLPSPEFLRFLQASIVRQGGAVAPTIIELDSQQYADAGIEENKAQINTLRDDANKAPPAEWAHLAGQFDALQSMPVAEPSPLESWQSPPLAEPTALDVLTAEVYALREIVATLITEIDSLKGKPS